jgi:FtsX-like permease family protein
VIAFGIRLALASGREALTRLLVIGAAVALGVGLLLGTLAGVNAVNAQNARYAWLNSGAQRQATGSTVDPLWWSVHDDYVDGQQIGIVDVAATGPDSPVPPGLPRLPGAGEYYVSPALAALIASTPADQLGDRYPGHRAGTIGRAALPSPKTLLIVVGHPPDVAAHLPDAKKITRIATLTPGNCADCEIGIKTAGMDLILSVVALALLFPVLIFIGAATRLTAARREQRFAAMRLIGATPRQVSVVAAVESTVAALAGTAAGFGVFFALRGPLAALPFTGVPFYPSDLSLGLRDVLLVALGVPVAAAVAARLALHRVRISPLGVTRRVTPKPPRAYRLIPLLVGLGVLAYFVGRRPATTNGQIAAFLPPFFVIMAGLVIAGPWLTMVGSRLLAHRARRPAALIAARRLADNPRAAFRAISGLILALFVTSVAIGVITTILAERVPDGPGGAARTALVKWYEPVQRPVTSVPAALTAELRATPGVRGVVVVRNNPAATPRTMIPNGLVDCAELARVPGLGRCATGAATAMVPPNFQATMVVPPGRHRSVVWPAASVPADRLARLPVLTLVTNTDGSRAAIERARTTLELGYPGDADPPATADDYRADSTSSLNGWVQLATVVILASLPIAGCSLAVSVAGGLSERKRPFSLLRLTGVPLRVLRRVVALESVLPLLVVAVLAIGTGLVSAQLFLRAQMGYTLKLPGPEYYLIVVAGLACSLGIIAATMPLLARVTGPETARNE